MARTTGIDDEAQIIQETGSTDITADLGKIITAGWRIEDPSTRQASVGSGASYQEQVDGLIIPRVNLSVAAPSFEPLKLMGSLSSGSISFDDILPTHEFKVQAEAGTVLTVTGVKFGEATVNISTDELVTIDFRGVGTDFEFASNTISTPPPSGTTQNYLDTVYKIDGTAIGSVETASVTYQRSLEALRGIEDTASGEKRLPTEIIEKIKDFTHDATIEITDSTAWEQVHDDSTLPVTPQDSRSNSSVTIDLDEGSSLQLSDGRFTEHSGELNEDKEVRTTDVSGNAISGSVTGL